MCSPISTKVQTSWEQCFSQGHAMSAEPGLDKWKSSENYIRERDSLSAELRSDFEALVEAYRYYAFLHHRQPFVSYKVMADLIRDGWRREG